MLEVTEQHLIPPYSQQSADNAILDHVIVMVDAVEKHHTPMLLWWYSHTLRRGKYPYNFIGNVSTIWGLRAFSYIRYLLKFTFLRVFAYNWCPCVSCPNFRNNLSAFCIVRPKSVLEQCVKRKFGHKAKKLMYAIWNSSNLFWKPTFTHVGE